MRNNLFTLALLAALTVGGSANAAWQLNGKSMNGKSMNGKSMNGTALAAESFQVAGAQVIDGRLVVAE